MRKIALLLIISIVFFGCAPRNQIHKYSIKIVDVEGKPVENANIEYQIKAEAAQNMLTASVAGTEVNKRIPTPKDSVVVDQIVAPLYDGNLQSVNDYRSSLSYRITKQGYYTQTGDLYSRYGSYRYESNPETVVKVVKLVRSIDYLSPEFTNSISDEILKEKILLFIDNIILKGLLANSILQLQSIQINDFKEKPYIHFSYSNVNVYNTVRMNKYDIAKDIFDEVIRKILTPMNNHIGASDLFYGYDIEIRVRSESFLDEYDSVKETTYRYLMPEETVRSYKNNDLSGQQLIDRSIVIMDDERIDLKLQ